MAANPLGSGLHDDVGAELERGGDVAARSKCVVDNESDAVLHSDHEVIYESVSK